MKIVIISSIVFVNLIIRSE